MRLHALPILLLLSGCGAVNSAFDAASAPPPPPVTTPAIHVCTPNKTWSASALDALAVAMGALLPASPIWTMELDWQAMRDANAACAKTNPK